METLLDTGHEFIVEAVRTPLLCEERNRNNLSESVHHESAAAHRVNDRSVVNNLNLDTLLNASQVQISVCGGAERITNNQEADGLRLGLLDHLIAARLDELTIRHIHILAVVFGEALIANHENRSVHFQIHVV